MDLQLIEQVLAEKGLGEPGPVHHHVPVTGGCLGLADRRGRVVHVVDPAALRLGQGATSKSAAPAKIRASPVWPLITGKIVTWGRSTRPAAMRVR